MKYHKWQNLAWIKQNICAKTLQGKCYVYEISVNYHHHQKVLKCPPDPGALKKVNNASR